MFGSVSGAHFNPAVSLVFYLKKELDIKDFFNYMFFQIISALAVIQKKYPGFRHNDLKANNILIHNIEVRNKNNKFKDFNNICNSSIKL